MRRASPAASQKKEQKRLRWVLTPAAIAPILLGIGGQEMENADLIGEAEYLKNLLSRVLRETDTGTITDEDLIQELNTVLGVHGW
jgi:hypothetical protein